MRPRSSLATFLFLVLAAGLALGLMAKLVNERTRLAERERLLAVQAYQSLRLARQAAVLNRAPGAAPPAAPAAEVERLRRENEALRARVDVLETKLRISGAEPTPPASSSPSR